jgi:hypothetical protein
LHAGRGRTAYGFGALHLGLARCVLGKPGRCSEIVGVGLGIVGGRRRALPSVLLACDIRHDLSHFHGLAGRHFLNAEDYLVIGRSGRVLEQFPKPLQ